MSTTLQVLSILTSQLVRTTSPSFHTTTTTRRSALAPSLRNRSTSPSIPATSPASRTTFPTTRTRPFRRSLVRSLVTAQALRFTTSRTLTASTRFPRRAFASPRPTQPLHLLLQQRLQQKNLLLRFWAPLKRHQPLLLQQPTQQHATPEMPEQLATMQQPTQQHATPETPEQLATPEQTQLAKPQHVTQQATVQQTEAMQQLVATPQHVTAKTQQPPQQQRSQQPRRKPQ